MNREQFIQHTSDEYGMEGEYLWPKYLLFCVFRHSSNRKWFAIGMDVPKNKLGLVGTEPLDVVNLKCASILIGSLRKEPGIFPAYHMSKANWISVALDGSVPDEQIKMLLYTGMIWIDAHPGVSTVKDGYPNAHAMVLGLLLGDGDENLTEWIENRNFEPDEIFYVGLKGLYDYQKNSGDEKGVHYKVQTDSFVSAEEISEFVKRFDHILVHLDIDVLDEHFFHSTYFANPELSGDGSGGGKMKMDMLADILERIASQADVVGFTIAEYLPFDEHGLHKMFSGIKLFTE